MKLIVKACDHNYDISDKPKKKKNLFFMFQCLKLYLVTNFSENALAVYTGLELNWELLKEIQLRAGAALLREPLSPPQYTLEDDCVDFCVSLFIQKTKLQTCQTFANSQDECCSHLVFGCCHVLRPVLATHPLWCFDVLGREACRDWHDQLCVRKGKGFVHPTNSGSSNGYDCYRHVVSLLMSIIFIGTGRSWHRCNQWDTGKT